MSDQQDVAGERAGGRRIHPSRSLVAVALVAAIAVSAGVLVSSQARQGSPASPPNAAGLVRPLPSPRLEGDLSLEAALQARRSVRDFTDETLTTAEIGQLLWAAQGRTDEAGHRTAPSAGALYPLEIDLVTADGIARYAPDMHGLVSRSDADIRSALQRAALDQAAVGAAPAVIVVSGVVERTETRYGIDRAERYVALEAGHAAQNVLLQAVALGFGAVPVGAFDDAAVRRVLALGEGEDPLYLIPVGHPR